MIKRFVINFVIVVSIVFILDFVIGKALRYFYFKESSGLHFRTTYAIETTKADILVFGSSRANHHYVPKVFEDSLKMSFYNTGRDANGIFYQTAILKSILLRYSPKIVILDYAGKFDNRVKSYDNISSLLPYYRNHEEIRGIVKMKSAYEKLKLLSEIYPFNSQILTIAIGNMEMNKKRYDENGGYVAIYNKWNIEIDSVEALPDYEVDSNKVNSFRDFLKIAKRSVPKVIVIYSPIYLKFKNMQEIEICKYICAKEKIAFWDYSKDTSFLNKAWLFGDVLHLNNDGAYLFSKMISNRLKYDLNLNNNRTSCISQANRSRHKKN